MTTKPPTSPSSWATIANTKSLWAAGNCSAPGWRLSPRPMPKTPPVPSASSPCTV